MSVEMFSFNMEKLYKEFDLLYSYNMHLGHTEDLLEILKKKKELSKKIMDELDQKGLLPRRCKHCGRELPWNYGYGICQSCYRRTHYHWEEDWDF